MGIQYDTPNEYVVMQSKKNAFFFIKKVKKKPSSKKNGFFMVFYYYLQFKGRKVFFNIWSAYSYYKQVVKYYIQYVNCIFMDSETNYLMNYNTNLHSNIKLHNYNL